MNQDALNEAACVIVNGIIARAPTKQDKSEILSMLLLASYNALRTIEDDQFVIGWLESALKDVRENPPVTPPRH